MAFDGITVSCIKKELKEKLIGGYITKIAQPEKDELLISIKNKHETYRLVLSANPSLPLVYISEKKRQSPMTAPAFCMLLRKHIGNGKVVDIIQPSMERVVMLVIEHRDELGDLRRKRLIAEFMGKHSNLILVDENDLILDSVRRIPASISSVREVLPGREYFIPQTQKKADPFTISEEAFISTIFSKSAPLSKAIYTSLTGFSPMAGEELCVRASLDGRIPAASCSERERTHLFHIFLGFMDDIKNEDFHPAVYYENAKPAEFTVFPSELYDGFAKKEFESVFSALLVFYSEKESASRMKQKSSDLRKIVSTALERNVRKYGLQKKQLDDTKKREKYRLYGELLTAYGYGVENKIDKLECVDYNTGENITIPLDPELSALENAKRYFEKYNKQKRTFEAVEVQMKETAEDIAHLESIQTALDSAFDEADLAQISDELRQCGYMKKNAKARGKHNKAKPLRFISSDGHEILVGKNNYQNDEISFSSPCGRDWWFHAKAVPGSHVVVKSETEELPDRIFEEAARLAAYFSKGRGSSKVEIDYTLRRNLKKPSGAKPGFVVYYTNYSMMAKPDISDIKQVDA